MTKTRAERAESLEKWADAVEPDDLVSIDTTHLRHIAALAEERKRVDAELAEAVETARRSDRSWSEIGTALGVSKQAAQRKYSRSG